MRFGGSSFSTQRRTNLSHSEFSSNMSTSFGGDAFLPLDVCCCSTSWSDPPSSCRRRIFHSSGLCWSPPPDPPPPPPGPPPPPPPILAAMTIFCTPSPKLRAATETFRSISASAAAELRPAMRAWKAPPPHCWCRFSLPQCESDRTEQTGTQQREISKDT